MVQSINYVERGTLLDPHVHQAFGDLEWGSETRTENGVCHFCAPRISMDDEHELVKLARIDGLTHTSRRAIARL